MSSGLTVFPASRAFVDEEVEAWLASFGVELPVGADRSEAPTVDELRVILHELGWAFREERSGSTWRAHEQAVDGRWPPFSELSLFGLDELGRAESFGFRLGPIEGPLEVVRRVAERRGAQIAVHQSWGRPVIVQADSDPLELLTELTT